MRRDWAFNLWCEFRRVPPRSVGKLQKGGLLFQPRPRTAASPLPQLLFGRQGGLRPRKKGEGKGVSHSRPRTGAVSPLLQPPVERLKLGPLQRAWRGHAGNRQRSFHDGYGNLWARIRDAATVDGPRGVAAITWPAPIVIRAVPGRAGRAAVRRHGAVAQTSEFISAGEQSSGRGLGG